MGNPRGNSRREEKKKYMFAGAAVCLVVLVALIGTAIGRYQRQIRSEGYARAKEFYFTSDFLDGRTHTITPEGTAAAFTFTLGNHADDLRFSEVDITYEVTVTPGNGVTVHYGNTGKKLANGEKHDDKVTVEGLTPGETYTVTATGTGGYQKTLTATVKVLSTEPKVYKYLDTTSSEYVLLTVWAQGYRGSVTITPPPAKGLIPDNTDPVMKDVLTGAVITDTTSFSDDSGYSSHTYRFFGSGVTAADFAVTYDGSKTAEVKEPS